MNDLFPMIGEVIDLIDGRPPASDLTVGREMLCVRNDD
jgi:hypothetical protein